MALSDLKKTISLQSRFNRDVLWNVMSLGVLGASGTVINFVILAVQGKDALGVFNQVFAFYIIVSQVAVGGLQFSALKHCSYNQDNMRECSKITSSALMLVAAVSLAMCAALWSARGLIGRLLESEPVSLGIAFSIPGLFLFSINKVLIMSINGLRHMRAFAVFQALRYVLILCGVVVIMALGYPGSHLALSLTLSEVVLFAGLMLYIRLRVFRMTFSLSAETRAWMRRHVSFGLRGFLSGVLVEMNTRVDILILGYYLSDATVGVYSFASIFAEGFAQLTTVMRQNVDPIVGKAFSERNKEKIHEMARKVRRTFLPIMAGLGAALVAGFPLLIYLLRLLGSDKGDYRSWGVFAILVCGTVLASGYRPFIAILLQGGRPGAFTLLMAFSVLTNAILCLCLIPLLSLYGASVATATVYVLEAVAIVVLTKRLFGIRL